MTHLRSLRLFLVALAVLLATPVAAAAHPAQHGELDGHLKGEGPGATSSWSTSKG